LAQLARIAWDSCYDSGLGAFGIYILRVGWLAGGFVSAACGHCAANFIFACANTGQADAFDESDYESNYNSE
jgi:hypothetical protein